MGWVVMSNATDPTAMPASLPSAGAARQSAQMRWMWQSAGMRTLGHDARSERILP